MILDDENLESVRQGLAAYAHIVGLGAEHGRETKCQRDNDEPSLHEFSCLRGASIYLETGIPTFGFPVTAGRYRFST